MHTKLSSGPGCPKFGLVFINIGIKHAFYAHAGPPRVVLKPEPERSPRGLADVSSPEKFL